MNGFKKVIQMITPYKYRVFSSLIFNIISTLFGLFSIGMMIPFLDVIFGKVKPLKEYDASKVNFGDFDHLKENIENLLNYTINSLINDHGASYALAFVGVIIIIASFIKNAFKYASSYTIAPVRNGVIKDVRNKIYHKISTLDLSYFSDEKKGNIISRVTHDVNDVESASMNVIFFLFREPVTLIFTLTTLLVMSVKLTLFVFIILPIAGLIIGKLGKSLRGVSFQSKTILGNIISSIEETLSGLRIIKAFNAEDSMIKHFENRNNYFTKTMNNIWRRQDLASPISEFFGTITVAALMWYGGTQVIEAMNGNGVSSLTASGFITYLTLFSQVISPAKNMSTYYLSIKKGEASFNRIDEVIKAENKIKEINNPKEIKDFNDHISYDNISFSYNGREKVIKNISFKVPKGKTVALVGQSGSGKSTLADLLPRFYDVNEGSICIDGINIKDLKIKNLRSKLGIVNQDAILFNDTIANNIAFAKQDATREEIIEAAKVANAHQFIEELENGYDTNIGDRGGKLSGGQRQRISIARAVLSEADIMILDEATSALDTESERLVQDALNHLMETKTSIVIAHRLSTIINADEIIVMNDGEIVEQGKHQELLTNKGYYYKLHSMQNN